MNNKNLDSEERRGEYLINKCIEAIKKADHYILKFKYELDSRDWDTNPFGDDDTKALLIGDCLDHFSNMKDLDILGNSKFFTPEEYQLKKLEAIAIDNYRRFYGFPIFFEALDDNDKKEYYKLYKKVHGEEFDSKY